MGVESATFITDFDQTLPTSTDLRSQGDDHIRLLKTVLKDNFPTASKAWYNPNTAAKSADFTVVAADMNKTFLTDTTAGLVNMTLPTLASGDAGWECFLLKTNVGVSPVLVKPATGTLSSGSISGLAAARRAIPNIRIQCLWTGTAWIISRAVAVPLGSALDLHVAALPVGFEWPNGQTLASANTNYPEFYSLNGSSGVVLDVRGRVGIPLDNLGGSAASRLAGGIITGTAVGNVGGTDVVTLSAGQIPTLTSIQTLSLSVTPVGRTNLVGTNGTVGGVQTLGGSQAASPATTAGGVGDYTSITTMTGSASVSATSQSTGGAGGGVASTHSNLQPSIMVAKILVVE